MISGRTVVLLVVASVLLLLWRLRPRPRKGIQPWQVRFRHPHKPSYSKTAYPDSMPQEDAETPMPSRNPLTKGRGDRRRGGHEMPKLQECVMPANRGKAVDAAVCFWRCSGFLSAQPSNQSTHIDCRAQPCLLNLRAFALGW